MLKFYYAGLYNQKCNKFCTCSRVRIPSRNVITQDPKEWYILVSAHGSRIFLAWSKSLLKKRCIAFFASINDVSKSMDVGL